VKLQRSTVVVCLLVMVCLPAGLSNPLPLHDSSQVQKGGSQKSAGPQKAEDGCGKALYNQCVDLCSLAKIMGVKPPVQTGQITLKSLDGKGKILLPKHAEVSLVANQDQLVWTCNGLPKGQTFQITKITRVLNPPDPNANNPKPRPDSPFCADITSQSGNSGSALYSGTPRNSAIGQWYKYSFRVNTANYDPHLIVTDGSGLKRRPPRQGCPPLPGP